MRSRGSCYPRVINIIFAWSPFVSFYLVANIKNQNQRLIIQETLDEHQRHLLFNNSLQRFPFSLSEGFYLIMWILSVL